MTRRIDNETAPTQDTVAIASIFVDESRNMRRFPVPEKYISELAESISTLGLLEPLVVKPYNGENPDAAADTETYKYTLVAGYCRYKALEQLDIPALVRVIEPDSITAEIFVNVAENIKRKDTSAVDLSYAIGKLKDGESTKDEETGTVTVVVPAMSLKDIAKEIGISPGYCGELDKVRGLRTAIQKKIASGDINWKLVRILITLDEAGQDELLAKAESGEVSQTALAEHFNDKKRAKKGGKAKKSKKGKSGGGGEGDGEEGEGGGRTVKPVSAKKAILVLEELAAKPGKDEDGNPVEETDAQALARSVFALFKKFMDGKLGQQALQKNVVKVMAGE